MKRRTINIITLGCAKNLVDSEHIMAQLEADGYGIIHDSNDTHSAKIVIVNTCGFINDAKEESVNTILQFAAAKQEGAIDRLFVTGCLSERYADELRAELPEVDDFFGVKDIYGVVKALEADPHEKALLKPRRNGKGNAGCNILTERHTTTPRHYAYLKIGEGCNWHCAYCAIPIIRGRHVSVPMEQLVEEAEKLASKGVRELIVVAQDTTYYGLDLYRHRRLAELLERLSHVKGIEWIRLHYTYPADFPEDVIAVMRDNPKICHYIDIPLQHISDNQLKAMRRRIDKRGTTALMERLRHEIPDIAIRTTLLTGFPGETEQDVEELLDFVRSQEFDRLGVFAYSQEEGTPSAQLPDDVPEEEKQRRVERIMTLQGEIAERKNQERIGRRMKVLVDCREGNWWVARTQYDSPEVDQNVLIKPARGIRSGCFYTVDITGADGYDLYGEPVF
jgi:ribosomal protein S12 methylthiotransferase